MNAEHSALEAEVADLRGKIERALKALAMDVRSSVRCAAAREELLGFDPLENAKIVAGL